MNLFENQSSSILVSPTSVSQDAVLADVEGKLVQMEKDKVIANSASTRVLILGGTHGSAKGISVVTAEDLKQFVDVTSEIAYQAYCQRVGKKYQGTETGNLHKPLQDDPNLKCLHNMTFEVYHMEEYHGKMQKLLDDIKAFDPTVLVIGWCHTNITDVTNFLRSEAFFAKMMMEHDIRSITGNPSAILSSYQNDFLKDINARQEDGELKYRHVLLSGCSGSGKTVCAVQFVKQRVADLKMNYPQIKIQVIICTGAKATGLLKEFEETFKDLTDCLPNGSIKFENLLFGSSSADFIDEQMLKQLGVEAAEEGSHTIYLIDEMRHRPGEEEVLSLVKSFSHQRLRNTTSVWAFNPLSRPAGADRPVRTNIGYCKLEPVLTIDLPEGFRNSRPVKRAIKWLNRITEVNYEDDSKYCPEPILKDSNGTYVNQTPVFIVGGTRVEFNQDVFEAIEKINEMLSTSDSDHHSQAIIDSGEFLDWNGPAKAAVEKWTKFESWSCAGREADAVIVLLDAAMFNFFECFTRARRALFIITTENAVRELGRRMKMRRKELRRMHKEKEEEDDEEGDEVQRLREAEEEEEEDGEKIFEIHDLRKN